MLKFNREEVGGADVDSLGLDALGIATAGIDLVSPVSKTGCIRLAIEEVAVVLADEEVSAVDGVGAS